MNDSKQTNGIECKNLGFSRNPGGNNHEILSKLDIRFETGTIHLIQGPVGAGKSTLLHMLALLIRPTQGEISYNGKNVSRWTGAFRDRFRHRIGHIAQSPKFMNGFSLLENIMLPLVPQGFSIDEIRAKSLSIMETLEIKHLAAKMPTEISGGESQRAAICRALIGLPDFILADEPISQQDDNGKKLIFDSLEHARKQGATIVIASHDIEGLDKSLFDSISSLDNGKLTPKS